jgi:hypothetical protein
VRVRLDEAACDLEADRDGDELLLDAVVHLTLDGAALFVFGDQQTAKRIHEAGCPSSGRRRQGG